MTSRPLGMSKVAATLLFLASAFAAVVPLACGSTGANGGAAGEGASGSAVSGGTTSGTSAGTGASSGALSGSTTGTGTGTSSSGSMGTGATGGGSGSAGAGDAGATDATVVPVGDGGCGQLPDGGYVWPNACSQANSDPWLYQHHDQIVQERPVALLLDFVDSFHTYENVSAPKGYDIDTIVQPLIQKHIDAFEVASTYHGYNDGTAPPFKTYSVIKVVDARDTAGDTGGATVNSSLLPLNSNGTSVDYSQFATQTWTDRIGIPDPANPGTNLSICQLFEKGIINEVWGMVADPATAKFDESAETKQAYDATNTPIAGKLLAVSNGQSITKAVPCTVSTRFYDFNPTRGPGCHLHANGHAWERYITAGALPAFAKVASTFFNFDFKTRFNAPFTSFYDVCPYTTAVCIDWQTPFPSTAAISGPSSSQTFSFSPLTAGCGNVHFPPNATTQYTTLDQGYDIPQTPATAPVADQTMSSCEHYGLHDGTGGADMTTPYSNGLAAEKYKAALGTNASMVATDCGGPQPTYIFASMPGLGNKATASDGTPMKNWWVYEFY